MVIEDKIGKSGGIGSHLFSASLTLWSAGEITKQNIVDYWNLDAAEQTQLDEIKTKYDGLNNFDKAAFHGIMEAANIAFEDNAINVTKWKSILGITT